MRSDGEEDGQLDGIGRFWTGRVARAVGVCLNVRLRNICCLVHDEEESDAWWGHNGKMGLVGVLVVGVPVRVESCETE